ncbi:MAG: hypothetical protein K2X66_08215 [Cyanobacteria bacterium]|nr:hypothetical protein [Cyanobacteriota bacterium]
MPVGALSAAWVRSSPSTLMTLILNGDIVDVTGSWFEKTHPWDPDEGKVLSLTLEILARIVNNNSCVFDELTEIIRSPKAEIIFVMGNHDGLLRRFPKAREYLRNRIATQENMMPRIRFVEALEFPELGLYAEHGHQFDYFNRSTDLTPHPLGDYINILLVNRFVDLIITKLQQNLYSTELIAEIHLKLVDIEYLRPFSLIPVWIENIAKSYKNHKENEGKKESIDTIILSVLSSILDTQATRSLIEQLHLPRKFLTSFVNWFVHIPGTLPIVSFLIAQAMNRTHSNRYQYKMAQKLHKERGYRLITFGHTHMPAVLPLSQDGYFFNTGSWKPVVNLFREPNFQGTETNLEYLIPNIQFNKIEKSGILVIEKNLMSPAQLPQFSLHTNESNHSTNFASKTAPEFDF